MYLKDNPNLTFERFCFDNYPTKFYNFEEKRNSCGNTMRCFASLFFSNPQLNWVALGNIIDGNFLIPNNQTFRSLR